MLYEATEQSALRARQIARKATFLLVGDAFKSRESAPLDPVDPMAGYGYMPRAVVAVLFPLRTPTAI